jgi:hypothetical protein
VDAPVDAVVERWPGEARLYVRALPGFLIEGDDSRSALRQAQAAMPAFLDWLRALELEPPVNDGDPLRIAEELAGGSGIGPRFALDLPATTPEELELALAVGRALISALIDAYDEAERDGDVSALGAALREVAARDRWHASRIGLTEIGRPPPEPIEDLVAAASTFEEAADSAIASSGPELAVVDGEEWTLAKALRRRTGHLRQTVLVLPELPG